MATDVETRASKSPRALLRKTSSEQRAACTHMTMVRLYTKEFRCQICYRQPTMGWLYRCTEDRELMMEQAFADGELPKMDEMCNLFEHSIVPKKRGPAERADKLSFFSEVDHIALETYSSEQLSIILKQRAEAVDVAKEKSALLAKPALPAATDPRSAQAYAELSKYIKGPKAPPARGGSAGPLMQPWTPTPESECQFKCCQSCRPHSAERAYLDLDAIVNDEIPITAAHGFGFHLSGGRPIHDAFIVRNLGLRPNPPTREERSTFSSQDRSHSQFQTPQVLGLFPIGSPLPAMRTSPNTSANMLPASSFASRYGHPGPTPSFQQFGSYTDAQSSRDITQAYLPISAGHPFLHPSLHDAVSHETRPTLQERLAATDFNVQFETAVISPLPEQIAEELEILSSNVMVMDVEEMEGGQFGDEPLEVDGGVAVTEEAVEMQVADLITQF